MDGAISLDARAVVDQSLVGRQMPPFSHLAIRPYPEEYTREATTSGGLQVTLRPIRPEDEPAWHEMLDACSAETISLRFSAMVRHTHEFATRFCFIDYDRELAIVAELESGDGSKKLAGVGRLVADPAHLRAEYAVLVADPWQRRGLGNLLTELLPRVGLRMGAIVGVAQCLRGDGRRELEHDRRVREAGFQADPPGRRGDRLRRAPREGPLTLGIGYPGEIPLGRHDGARGGRAAVTR